MKMYAVVVRSDGACRIFANHPAFHKGGTSYYYSHYPWVGTPTGLCHGVLGIPLTECCAFDRRGYTPSTAREFDLRARL